MTAKIKKAINNSKSYQKDENSQPKNYENYEKQENNENHKKTNSQTSQFSSEIQKIKRDTYISWIFMAILLLPILDFDIEISYIMIIIAVALGTVFLFFKTRAICLLRKVSKNVKLLKVYVAYIIFLSFFLGCI